MADLIIKQGDNYPPLTAVLSDLNGPIDLTTAVSVVIHMKGQTTATVVTGTCTTTFAGGGAIQYAWGATDTATPDTYNVEFEITWPGGQEQTVPNDGYRTILVEAELA